MLWNVSIWLRIWIWTDYWEQFKQQKRIWDKELLWQGSAYYILKVEGSLLVSHIPYRR